MSKESPPSSPSYRGSSTQDVTVNYSRMGISTLAFSSLALFAAAQAAPPPAKPSAPMQAAPATPKDDPAKVAAARDFIVAFHPQIDPKNVTMRLNNMMPQMIAAAKMRDPKVNVKEFETEMRARQMSNAAKILDIQSHVVSGHFTLAELKGLTAFYRGPLGRKLTAETPKIQMEVMRQARLQLAPVPGMPSRAMMPPSAMAPAKPASPVNAPKTPVPPPSHK